MESKPSETERNPLWLNERRREIRLRRSHLLENPAEQAFTYKIATERAELEKSFELVWESYVKVGLQAPDSDPIRFTKYHLLPTTKIFTATYKPELLKDEPDYEKAEESAEIVGTLTLVEDSSMGLPMEEVCSESVQELRDAGAHPAEVIALAVNPEYRQYNLMMYLYKLMFEYARKSGVTDITCSVTKRHIRFYQTMLLFEPMGELMPYTAANGMEVQCHRLNVDASEESVKDVYHDRHFDADLYTFFFTENKMLGRSMGKGHPMSEENLRYFLAERTRFLDSLDEKTRAVLRQEYEKHGCSFPY